jgi:flagellum-specific peptidoglycan hydrolase FlgJ
MLGVLGIQGSAQASRKQAERYIQTYSAIAVAEMNRTGIPASVKLAQAILESDMGRSDLARLANNHFGIKCGRDWQGEVYYKPDDEKDTTGVKVNSCFRSFPDGSSSFKAHSDFLTNPAKKARYGPLFELSVTDYKSWAYGLKNAGYATDPAYPEKLIRIIEEFRLHMYDASIQSEVGIQEKTEKIMEPAQINMSKKQIAEKEARKSVLKYKTSQINGVIMVYARGGETLRELSEKLGYDVYEILEYNEEAKGADASLEVGEIIYLARKRKLYDASEPLYHTVAPGETTYTIAQKYGIRLESLLAKNHLPPQVKVHTGERLSLTHVISKKETPKYSFVERFEKFLE